MGHSISSPTTSPSDSDAILMSAHIVEREIITVQVDQRDGIVPNLDVHHFTWAKVARFRNLMPIQIICHVVLRKSTGGHRKVGRSTQRESSDGGTP
jgi:hypothetical protein